MESFRQRFYNLLRWSERYTKTDMVYLFSSGSWLFIGQLSALFFSLGLAVIFGHYATQDTYGNYKYILSLATVLGALSLSGLTTGVTRAVAAGNEGSLAQGFALNLRYSGGIVAGGLLASLYYWIHGNIFVSASLILVALIVPLTNGFSLYDAFYTGKRAFKPTVLCAIGSLSVTTIALAITLLFFSQRAIVLVAIYLLTNLATDILWYFLARNQTSNIHTDTGLKRYSLHLSLMNIITMVASKIDSITIFVLLGPAQLAVYSFAIALPEQFRGLVGNLANLSFPNFTGRSIAEIRKTLARRLIVLTLMITLAMGAYSVLASFVFQYLFPIYIESIPYSQWYAFAIIPTGISIIVITILQAHEQTRALYIATNVGSIALIVFLPVGAYFWGIPGAIAALFLSRVVLTVVSLWQFYAVVDADAVSI